MKIYDIKVTTNGGKTKSLSEYQGKVMLIAKRLVSADLPTNTTSLKL